jgi:type II secretory pathway pseudopilin PulG
MGKKATTLIELILAVAIIFIIGGAVIISIGIANRKQLEVDAKSFVADLWLYRELAASRRNTYIFDFDTVTDSYEIYNGSVAANNLLKTKTFRVDLASVTNFAGTPRTEMTIRPPYNAAAPADDSIVNLTRDGRSKIITVFGDTGYIQD